MGSAVVRYEWECFVKPEEMPEESKQPYHLTPWDLQMLQLQYAQRGVLFLKPQDAYDQENFMKVLLEKLKTSLSQTLFHYYPLTGRLKILKQEKSNTFSVSVDCNNSPGAKFVYATSDLRVSDFVSKKSVPNFMDLLFDDTGVFNYEGDSRPLLSVQVTELVDGMCMGLAVNHGISDGTSGSSFLTTWSEIFHSQENISRKPVFNRFFPDGYGPIINLPTTYLDDIMSERKAVSLKVRIFHLSSDSIAKLKEKAVSEENMGKKISSFQVMTALLWRCITRSRKFHPGKTTTCCFSANNRPRLIPPLSGNYYGNMVSTAILEFTAGEVLSQNLGWAALKVNQAVDDLTDKTIREQIGEWLSCPRVFRPDRVSGRVKVGSSPRFNKYENEFGMGRGVAICNGSNNKSDGKVSAFPGREGGGSMDLEVCLSPESMEALESDREFLSYVS